MNVDPDGAGAAGRRRLHARRLERPPDARARRRCAGSSTSRRSRSARTRRTSARCRRPPRSGDQAANLDNNSGAETADEQALVNYALASGIYNGVLAGPGGGHARAHRRGPADPQGRRPGDAPPGRHLATGRSTSPPPSTARVEAIVVTDTLPDGLCPLGDENYENGERNDECDPVRRRGAHAGLHERRRAVRRLVRAHVGPRPTSAAAAPPRSTYPTRTRTNYQESFADGRPRPRPRRVEQRRGGHRRRTSRPAASRTTRPTAPRTSTSRRPARRPAASQIEKTVRQPGTGAAADCDTGTYIRRRRHRLRPR